MEDSQSYKRLLGKISLKNVHCKSKPSSSSVKQLITAFDGISKAGITDIHARTRTIEGMYKSSFFPMHCRSPLQPPQQPPLARRSYRLHTTKCVVGKSQQNLPVIADSSNPTQGQYKQHMNKYSKIGMFLNSNTTKNLNKFRPI